MYILLSINRKLTEYIYIYIYIIIIKKNNKTITYIYIYNLYNTYIVYCMYENSTYVVSDALRSGDWTPTKPEEGFAKSLPADSCESWEPVRW